MTSSTCPLTALLVLALFTALLPGTAAFSRTGSPRDPQLMILAFNGDYVYCGCSVAVGNAAVNDDVETCGAEQTLCIEVINVTQPATKEGECNDVTGLECEDRVAQCESWFDADIHYVDDCCCGTETIRAEYSNPPFGTSTRIVSLGDYENVRVLDKADCNKTGSHNGLMDLKVRCVSGGAIKCYISLPFTCNQCRQQQ